MKAYIVALLKKLILAADTGTLSLTKLGSWVIALLVAALSAGIIPPEYVQWAKFLIALATGTAVAGARDAFGSKK